MANVVTNADNKAFVVNAGESFAGDFVNFEEMMEIGGGEVLAKITVAIWVERSEHFAVFGILDINAAVWGVEGAVAGLASWGDAVESIAAVFDTEE